MSSDSNPDRTTVSTSSSLTVENDDELFDVLPTLSSDRYELESEIDRGGTGIIYKAKDARLPRDVAVKVVRTRYADSAPTLAHFAYEAAIMSYLAHPGVIPIYDSGSCEDGRPFHAMKLINGCSLATLLREDERPKRSELVSIFVNVCHTIAFAHEQGVVHLDLKPSNILIGAFGNVLVTDWGLSRFVVDPPRSSRRAGTKSTTVFENRRHADVHGTGASASKIC